MSLGETTRDEIAATMDVTPSTISRWLADKGAPPKRPYLLLWAMATGVDVNWLEHGVGSPAPTPGPDGPRGDGGSKLAKLTAQKRSRAYGEVLPEGIPTAA